MRRWSPILLLALAACNRHGVADVTMDADAAQRNATSAKTRSDLAAADAASRGPAPVVRDVPPPALRPAAATAAPSTEDQDSVPADTDEAQSNE